MSSNALDRSSDAHGLQLTTANLGYSRESIWLEEMLGSVIRTSTWTERETLRRQFLDQGARATSAVFAKLSRPQSPEVVDLLVEYLARWESLDHLLGGIQDRNQSTSLRVALIRALLAVALDEGGSASGAAR